MPERTLEERNPWGTIPMSGGNAVWRTCPLCNGKGVNPYWITKVCPKCHGERKVALGA